MLMLAYSNSEAIELTNETGLVHFFSRSRDKIWLKGETSGNTMRLIESRQDCDQDTLLYKVIPSGPACHTGTSSCFNPDEEQINLKTFDYLTRFENYLSEIIDKRQEGSYTVKLYKGSKGKLIRKIIEEAGEVAESFIENDGRLSKEIADLFYHLSVLMLRDGLSFDRVYQELDNRRKA
ncbi:MULTISPECIES: bifunctional phosphoribosyl-AMP cyclohydrolase/phosphoribosyl-ATP diphosphatase HisIE [unclassified Fusibacter]|uniref:bifunctional phosphoribosyl-AMP cyclohydrolase/phosphoribosyl-ATP diphosphatase HisIE n=1 Tax=unclassified Fusibacter TaxID=2624464 RepID=UPI001FA99394|nr:bifunctional phosphoribosyl-AMP cyclohydrolase/phosphoribosyl-ATP diphosphatase HisIE [Fusibacter sp. A1]MCK8058851.1 bifunctional phosphoribosyl-AMP cyclohydrolase/phosphoribosyl-ATP diphosphatase HisIE [Fusibacter sp. A2]